MAKKNKILPKYRTWIEARRFFKFSHAHIQIDKSGDLKNMPSEIISTGFQTGG